MLQDLKDYLKISWDIEDTYLQYIIERGKKYLSDVTGKELNYEDEGPSRSLLLDYCRYYYHNTIEHFEENFMSHIKRLMY